MAVNAPLPMEDVIQLLSDNWNNSNNTTPSYFIKHNSVKAQIITVNIRRGTAVIGRPSVTTQTITPIGNWAYGNIVYDVAIEIQTAEGRQDLMDMAWEAKRILFANKHAMTNFQRVQWQSFDEAVDENINMWTGFIQVQLKNDAVKLDTT